MIWKLLIGLLGAANGVFVLEAGTAAVLFFGARALSMTA